MQLTPRPFVFLKAIRLGVVAPPVVPFNGYAKELKTKAAHILLQS